MNTFVKKLSIFLALLAILSIVFITISFITIQNQASTIRFEEHISTIIIGDSHTQTAINDSIFPNSLNISMSGEHFFYSYLKLKRILPNNKKIKNVYLGVSYHSFSGMYDKFVFNYSKTKLMFPRYFSLFTIEDFKYLVKHNSFKAVKILPEVFREHVHLLYITHPEIEDYPFMGNFEKRSKSKLNYTTVNKAIKSHYLTGKGNNQSISKTQSKWLHEIINLCKNKDIVLYLINTPISKDYKQEIPDLFLKNYEKNIDSALLNITVKHLDYSQFELPKHCYGDGDHINQFGAEIFTKQLIKEKN